MRDPYGFAEIAHYEGAEYDKGVLALHGIQTVLWAAILSGCVYFGLSLPWLVVVAFVALSLTLGATIMAYGSRLDVGRSFIEQTVHQIDENVTDLQITSHRNTK